MSVQERLRRAAVDRRKTQRRDCAISGPWSH